MAHDALHEARTVDSPILASSKGAGNEGKEHGDEGVGGQAGSSALERLPDELLEVIFLDVVDDDKKAELLCISKRLQPVVERAFWSGLTTAWGQQAAVFQQLAFRKDVTSLVRAFTYELDCSRPESTIEYESSLIGAMGNLKSLAIWTTTAEGGIATFPATLRQALRHLPHLIDLTIDSNVGMSFAGTHLDLEFPRLRHLTLTGPAGDFTRSLLTSPSLPLVNLSVNWIADSQSVTPWLPWQRLLGLKVSYALKYEKLEPFLSALANAVQSQAIHGPLPLRQLDFEGLCLFDISTQEASPADHQAFIRRQLELLDLLAQVRLERFAIQFSGEIEVPQTLPVWHSVLSLDLTGCTIRLGQANALPTLLTFLRALPALRHLALSATFNDDGSITREFQDPLGDASLLDHPNLAALVLYLRQSKVLHLVWDNGRYVFHYVRQNTTEDFQVDRVSWW
ncbi:hypothetical protein JCM10207_003837 [Rhodosporidiobolus poonsookiae]